MTMSAVMNQEGEQRKRPVLRYLRIAFSAVCGFICLLLIALWVRSLSTSDFIIGVAPDSPTSQFVLESRYGHLGISRVPEGLLPSLSMNWSYSGNPNPPGERRPFPWRTRYARMGFADAFVTPAWTVVLLLAAIASAPWFRWRFILRTLLIAMTLIAMGVGILASWN